MPTELDTEELATLIARIVVRDKLRSTGIKLTSADPKQITEASEQLVHVDPQFLQRAKAALAGI